MDNPEPRTKFIPRTSAPTPPPIHKPQEVRFLSMIVFGPPGHGKTTLMGTAQFDERLYPMLFLSFEGGETSLAGLDIDVMSIRSWDDYNEAFKFLRSGQHQYKSVCIDSLTETHVFALLQLAGRRSGDVDSAESLVAGIVGTGDGDKFDPDQFIQSDYGKAKVQVLKILRGFRSLPMHTFFTALAKEQTDVREGVVKVPAFSGSIPDELPGIVHAVSYLALRAEDDGTVTRVLVLKNTPKIRTKVRTAWQDDTVPDTIDNPTLGLVLDALKFPTA